MCEIRKWEEYYPRECLLDANMARKIFWQDNQEEELIHSDGLC